ncbi:hypothetical protein GCM10011328_40140 [Hafnia psychrotolerans]|uniref:beta-galactosidase n=1 Tax=Hafnia psychrotolerans TaxID=1477018 RepID=A0ABQ1H7P5_9GAMM|nr:hypothetical protein GCM10011328_40140 [Hafnia psychrotolerans]
MHKPAEQITDYQVRTHLFHDFTQAELEVQVSAAVPQETARDYQVHVQLWLGDEFIAEHQQALGSEIIDERGHAFDKTTVRLPVSHPALWSAEQPALYRVVISLISPTGELIEAEACDVGFRQVEISNGLLKVNGQPVLIRGTNRHEHHPENGQVMDEATMRRDIVNMVYTWWMKPISKLTVCNR